MRVYEKDKTTYASRKHCCVNWIWYPCCLSVEAQYLRRSCDVFLRIFSILAHNLKYAPKAKFQNQWSFRICSHGFYEITQSQNHENYDYRVCAFWKQKSLLLLNLKISQLRDLTSPLSTLISISNSVSFHHELIA